MDYPNSNSLKPLAFRWSQSILEICEGLLVCLFYLGLMGLHSAPLSAANDMSSCGLLQRHKLGTISSSFFSIASSPKKALTLRSKTLKFGTYPAASKLHALPPSPTFHTMHGVCRPMPCQNPIYFFEDLPLVCLFHRLVFVIWLVESKPLENFRVLWS